MEKEMAKGNMKETSTMEKEMAKSNMAFLKTTTKDRQSREETAEKTEKCTVERKIVRDDKIFFHITGIVRDK